MRQTNQHIGINRHRDRDRGTEKEEKTKKQTQKETDTDRDRNRNTIEGEAKAICHKEHDGTHGSTVSHTLFDIKFHELHAVLNDSERSGDAESDKLVLEL